MCMYSDNAGLQRDNKEVKGWKVLEIVEGMDGEKVYVTPYQFMRVTQSMLEGAEPVLPKDRPIWSGGNMRIDNGFIHIYGDIEPDDLARVLVHHCAYIGTDDTWITSAPIAQNNLPVHKMPRVLGIALCECVIPADTDFLHGETEIPGSCRYVDGYAASSVYIKRVAHEFTVYIQDSLERIVENLIKERNAG